MINYMWYTQNVFITFMPYGKVTQVDTSDATDFDESACASNFKAKEPDIVICNTDDWGWGDYLGPGNGPADLVQSCQWQEGQHKWCRISENVRHAPWSRPFQHQKPQKRHRRQWLQLQCVSRDRIFGPWLDPKRLQARRTRKHFERYP